MFRCIVTSIVCLALICPVRLEAAEPTKFYRQKWSAESWSKSKADYLRALAPGEAKKLPQSCGVPLGANQQLLRETEEIGAAAVSQFQDQFGKLIFSLSPNEHHLPTILNKLRSPTTGNSHELFVVNEWILESNPNSPLTDRRTVFAFRSQNTNDQVMISTLISPTDMPVTLTANSLAEVWGWDAVNEVFRYYEWSGTQWIANGQSPRPGDAPSIHAGNRCLQCHRTGTPLMKEMRLPWNNWHSSESPAEYLRAGGFGSWPVAIKLPPLAEASKLESTLKPLIALFNRKALAHVTSTETDGTVKVRAIRELVEPVFVEREFQLGASRTVSGLSPVAPSTPPATDKVAIPGSFFLRDRLIGGRESLAGLGVGVANQFEDLREISINDYRTEVTALKLTLAGPQGSSLKLVTPADADFAWFTPERSFVDDHLVDQLIKARVVTKEFVAAACRLDVAIPVFSMKRETVFGADIFPDEIIVPGTLPPNHRDHPLTKHVLNRITVLHPPAGSPLHEFKVMLDRPLPLDDLTIDLQTLKSAATSTALDKLMKSLVERRQVILANPKLAGLDETVFDLSGRISSQGLLPLPK